KIRCFNSNPSVKSSLKFLRKTPWARKKVEELYLTTVKREKRKKRKAEMKRLNKRNKTTKETRQPKAQ
ncbi:MAG: VF530 family DNA-binding protein, partial [Candidatus Fermentibacteria bacterium]|nr:VF530 family DNA-binding protein [Candidatus Fermentibacteria bacterium]